MPFFNMMTQLYALEARMQGVNFAAADSWLLPVAIPMTLQTAPPPAVQALHEKHFYLRSCEQLCC